MKSIKFFAALAIPAMFAACTNEEIVVDTPQKMQEVVGAELVGSDISLSASNGNSVESRLAGGKSGWETQDKLGLGWVTWTSPTTAQNVANKPSKNVLYANHLFEKAGEGDMFSTKGNVYKGWHFAYYPFGYMEEVAEKVIEINPKQTVGYHQETTDKNTPWNKRLSERFQMSALQFLTKEQHLDPETYQLKTTFPMKSPLGQIVVTTQLEENSAFATNANLQKYNINYVKINLGKEAFADYAKLNLKELYVLDADVDKANMDIPTANKVNTDGLLNSFKDVLVPTDIDGTDLANRNVSVTTEVAKDVFKVTDNKPRIQMFVLPVAEAIEFIEADIEGVIIEVGAGGGHFEIAYTAGDDLTADEKANNDAIVELVKAYSSIKRTDGKKTEGELVASNEGDNVVLNVVLRDKKFVADFTGVNNDNWADKVQLANDLSLVNQEFVLEEGANIVFEGDHLDKDGNMLVPNGGVVIKTVGDNFENGTLTIAADAKWNDKVNVVESQVRVTIADNVTLTVDSELMPERLVNNGTIVAGANSVIGAPNRFINYDLVDVTYGAKVNAHTTQPLFVGKIAYKVLEGDESNKVQELFASDNANVNTLIVDKGITLECEEPLDLSNINLEINGGTVTAEGYAVAANNVTIAGGSIINVDAAALTVKAGDNATTLVKELEVATDVNVEAGSDVSLNEVDIEGDLINAEGASTEISADVCVTIGDIINNGTLETTTDVYVSTIVLGNKSVTNVEDGKTIWYMTADPEFVQNGKTAGKIEFYSNDKFEKDLQAAAVNGGTVVLPYDKTLTSLSLIDVEKDIIIKGASKETELTLDLADQQIVFNNSVTFENITIDPKTTNDDGKSTNYEKYVLFNKDVVLKNVVVKNNIGVAGNAIFENVTFEGGIEDTYALWIAPYGNTINVNGCLFESNRAISIFDEYAQWPNMGDGAEVSRAYLNISGTTFNTNYKTVIMAGAPVTVDWSENNIITGPNEDKLHPVWIRYEYWKDDANKIKNIEANCGIYCE